LIKAGWFKFVVTALFLTLCTGVATADEIRVAVASNFTEAIKSLAERFELNTGHKVTLIFGSTGKHYAQIKNGAPFDVFFAADARRPTILEDEGEAIRGSRFTYAVGKIVLWSPDPKFVDSDSEVLRRKNFRYLAIANPKLAPYGKAAQEALNKLGLWDGLTGSMVRGENIGQTFQFVKSGNAKLGLVAYSQLKRPGELIEGSLWEVPESLYSAIEQQAVLLKSHNETARGFLSFVKSEESKARIRGFGYSTP